LEQQGEETPLFQETGGGVNVWGQRRIGGLTKGKPKTKVFLKTRIGGLGLKV